MPKRRRRKSHSIWLDTLQHIQSASKMRRSARDNPERTNSIASPMPSNEISSRNPLFTSPNGDTVASHENPLTEDHAVEPNRIRATSTDDLRRSVCISLSTLPAASQHSPALLSDAEQQRHPVNTGARGRVTTTGSGASNSESSSRSYQNTEVEQPRRHPDLEEISDRDLRVCHYDTEQEQDIEEGYEGHDHIHSTEVDEGILGPNPTPANSTVINSAPSGDAVPGQSRCSSEPARGEDQQEARIDLDILGNNLQIWEGHPNLTALVAVVGSVRYTVNQYDYMRYMLRDAGADPTWPPYERTQTYFQAIVETVMPKSELVSLPKANVRRHERGNDEAHSDAEGEVDPDLDDGITASSGDPVHIGTEKVRVFLPSSWAKLDVATSVVFNVMFPCFEDRNKTPRGLESSAIVQDRPAITNTCDYIFVNCGGEQMPCKPGTSVEVSVQSHEQRFDFAFRIHMSEDKYVLHATIAATWSVGGERGGNRSLDRALSVQSLSPQQKRFIISLSTALPPRPLSGFDNSGPLPGDICTLLSSERGDSDEFTVLIHRFRKYDDGIPSVTLIWVRMCREPRRSRSPNGEGSIEVLHSHVVDDIRMSRNAHRPLNNAHPAQGNSDQTRVTSHGTLADGTRFLIYRMLLYCDDFQKSSAMYPKGSAGGCYFLPLSLPPEGRRNTSSVRIISLTPPGVSTNDVLHFIVKNIVNATVQGVEGRTPMGERVKIFIDVVGFVGNYPASSSVVDVIGHICVAPCTLCTFRRLQAAGTTR